MPPADSWALGSTKKICAMRYAKITAVTARSASNAKLLAFMARSSVAASLGLQLAGTATNSRTPKSAALLERTWIISEPARLRRRGDSSLLERARETYDVRPQACASIFQT